MKSVRFALRALSKSPVFTGVAVLSLALGIGANTAIFTLMDQILLRMLPIREPERIVQLEQKGPTFGTTRGAIVTSYPMYRDLRDGNNAFDGVIARFTAPIALGHKGQTERATAELVSGNYFDVLGLQARAGRLLGPEDDRTPGAHPVAVLAYGYWQRKFGGDKNILQNTIQMNGHPLTVIGIAPPGFQGVEVGGATDVFVPVMMKKQATPTWDGMEDRRDAWLQVFARLKPGITPQQAQASLEPLYKQILNAEVDTLPADKPLIREAFLKEKKLIVDEAGKGSPTCGDRRRNPLRIDGDGGPGAADRLRECGEPPDGTRGSSAEGDCDSDLARSFAMADRTATAGGKRSPVAHRRMPGAARRRLDRRSADQLSSVRGSTTRVHHGSRCSGACLQFRDCRCCGSAVRTCSGDSGYSQGYRRYAEGGSREYVERQRPGSTAERAWLCSDLLVADVADRRGIVCAQSLQSQDACIRASPRKT